MPVYHTTSNHLNALQYSEPYIVAIQYPTLIPKEGLQFHCSWQHRDIICLHAVALDLASKHWWNTWLFECLAFVWYYWYPVFRVMLYDGCIGLTSDDNDQLWWWQSLGIAPIDVYHLFGVLRCSILMISIHITATSPYMSGILFKWYP